MFIRGILGLRLLLYSTHRNLARRRLSRTSKTQMFWIAHHQHGVEGLDHENAIGHIPHQAESLKPVEEVFLEKSEGSVVK